MSLKKLLDVLERIEFRKQIKLMYDYYRTCSKPELIAKVIIAWIFEYFAGCIDCGTTRTMGALNNTVRNTYGEYVTALNDTISSTRHIFVHEPYKNLDDRLTGSVIKYNTHETIQKFCSVFDDDAKEFELIYKDVMETLGLYKAPETFDTEDVKYSKWDDSYLGIQG